jgi:hypothetical protein
MFGCNFVRMLFFVIVTDYSDLTTIRYLLTTLAYFSLTFQLPIVVPLREFGWISRNNTSRNGTCALGAGGAWGKNVIF